MEEFVGLNPDKARRLVSSLRDTADRLVKLRNNLARAVQDARAELAPGGEHGPGTFTRYIDFLNESARDLEWRIRVITSGSLPPPTPDGIVTGKVGFLNEEEAKRQGSADGEAAGRDWLNGVHLGGNLDAWLKKLNEMIAKGQGDPAYATAFFLSLGAWLQDIISDAFYRYAGPDRVLDAQELEKARGELGPMAQMLALALAHGKLSKEYRDKLLGSDPRVLSLLLNLAPRDFPSDFMAEATRKILEGNDREAKILALQALSENADACLRYFQDLENVRWLMHPELLYDGDRRPDPLIGKILKQVFVNSEPNTPEQRKALENFAAREEELREAQERFKSVLRLIIDVTPYLGTAVGISEALFGRDVITGQELSMLERLERLEPGPRRAVNEAIKKALGSADKDKKLEGEVADSIRDHVIDFDRKVGPNGSVGQVDVETRKTIIEVTTQRKGKRGQIMKAISDPEMNPNGKPVILYAPNYQGGAGKDIEEAGGYVARTPEELKALLRRFGEG